jgi:uncharacterized membrane protein HdeD (DUF308 family)
LPIWRKINRLKRGNAVASSSDFGRPTNLSQGVEALRAKWGWIVALGIIYLLVGLLALYSVVTATIASVFVVGIMMLIAGVAEVVNAFQVKSWGKFFLWVVLGILYIVAGFVTFENPLLAAALLTLVLGAVLVASGIMRIILAFNMKEGTRGSQWCSRASSRSCLVSSYWRTGQCRASTFLDYSSALNSSSQE